MNIVEKRLDEIRPYANNPRKNDEAVEAVANSIREFGWKQPIVVDADGVIIVGHTRYKAAQELGLETVPVLVASDLSDEQARAFANYYCHEHFVSMRKYHFMRIDALDEVAFTAAEKGLLQCCTESQKPVV